MKTLLDFSTLDAYEKYLFEKAYIEFNGNLKKIGSSLNIHPRAVYRKLLEHGIKK